MLGVVTLERLQRLIKVKLEERGLGSANDSEAVFNMHLKLFKKQHGLHPDTSISKDLLYLLGLEDVEDEL